MLILINQNMEKLLSISKNKLMILPTLRQLELLILLINAFQKKRYLNMKVIKKKKTII